MSGIHNAILEYVQGQLEAALITVIPVGDPTRVGVVKIGHLQGDPAPDEARISVTLHESDPDKFIKGALTALTGEWNDEVAEIELGGTLTTDRKFTVKGRCLFESTREELEAARAITSIVRDRIEKALLRLPFSAVVSGDEYVSRGPISEEFASEQLQAGGPPDAYDYHFKIRFSIWTTRNGATL
jgi:hypothetical protein